MAKKNEIKVSRRTEVSEFVPIENNSLGPLKEYSDLRTVEDMMALQAALLAALMEARGDDREFLLEHKFKKQGIIFSKKFTSTVVLKRRS